jgi:pyruvate formate lyase activating enzyme
MAIFLQGCNIKCIYCHNPETINFCNNCGICVDKCPAGALKNIQGKVVYDKSKCVECDSCITVCPNFSSPKIQEYTVEELYKIVEEYRYFLRGITVSGGEPTIQHSFIAELFKRVKPLGLTCFVDSNGFFEREEISDLISETDKFMIDIKAIDSLEKLCGTKMKNNIDNLKYLLSLDKVHEVRSVIIKDYMDAENTVFQVANILKEYPEVTYKLIKVHGNGLKQVQKDKIKEHVPEQEYMYKLAELAREIGVNKIEV